MIKLPPSDTTPWTLTLIRAKKIKIIEIMHYLYIIITIILAVLWHFKRSIQRSIRITHYLTEWKKNHYTFVNIFFNVCLKSIHL